MILVDTSVWVDFLRGTDTAHRHLLHRLIDEEEDISVAGIIITEILEGIRNDKDFRRVRDYMLEFPLYTAKGVETYINAAQIFRNCRKKGKTVRKTVDCIIAAICIENGLTLFHKDSDFDLIEDTVQLKVLKF